MANIVDIVEDYIKARLSQSNGGIIVFRRNELAEKFQCVPSQINYVLSTRFNPNRGYLIETRRGGGGFIRVIKISLDQKQDVVKIIYDRIGENLSLNEGIGIIRYLLEEDKITVREAYIMENVIRTALSEVGPATDHKRASLLKTMLMVLLRHHE